MSRKTSVETGEGVVALGVDTEVDPGAEDEALEDMVAMDIEVAEVSTEVEDEIKAGLNMITMLLSTAEDKLTGETKVRY